MGAIEDKFALVRSMILCKEPYLSSALVGLIPHPVEGLGTMGVTAHLVLIYDPAWVLSRDDLEIASTLVHETHHVLRGHTHRLTGPGIDPELANIATDLTINDDITESGWKLPHGVYCAEKKVPRNLTAEQYYHLLQEKGGDASGGVRGTGSVGGGRCGGVGGNPIDAKLEEEIDQANEGGRTDDEVEAIQAQVAHDIQEFVKARGTAPGWMTTHIHVPRAKPTISWRQELRAVLRKTAGQIQSGGQDYSMARPSKRSAIRGIVRPGLIDRKPNVLIVLDTSGSMDLNTQIRDALRETVGIFQGLGLTSAQFLMADTVVAGKVRQVRLADLRSDMEISGRGGTSFIPAFKEAVQLKPRPDLLVYLTDGDGDAPKTPPPRMAVVWGIVPGPFSRKAAPWGKTVFIKDA